MRRASIALAVVVVAGGCLSVKPLVVDRQTQLENQFLGRLHRLEAELILASSVRAAQPSPSTETRKIGGNIAEKLARLSPLRREVVRALRNRAFNADDVDALKDAGVVGERQDGLLELLSAPRDRVAASRAKALVARENRDRERILRGIVRIDPLLHPRDLPLVRRIFHRLQRATARPGQKLQAADGSWVAVSASAARGVGS